jgi:PKD repeat protein
VDVEYKNLVPQIAIVKQTSDYVPSSITVDGSQSWSENNEIIKFIYNFWEWKIDSVGDAIQTYEYKTPGEKTITLTVIDDTWAQAQVKKTIVLKEAPRTISFVPSISPWIVWLPIDFSANIWWGTLEWYLWSFGDNTASQRWETVTHIFTKPWEYKVTLTATYADGTQQQTTSTYRVTLWEE